MWTNLFSCDENKRTPSDQVGDILRGFRILPNEITILRPDAVIFLTGPRYDYTLKHYFPDPMFKKVAPDVSERQLAQVTHKDLPPLTFRTYHPSSLKRQKKLRYVDMITNAIKDAWAAQDQSVQ